jgi:DNA-binding transcriptional MerR regulator
MERFKIDQVAAQSGLTKRTIRYYEEIGLLPPPQRSEGGVRYYTPEHVALLKKIKQAKDALGFSLHELQNFISLGNIIETQKIGYKQAAERAEQKEKLRVIIETLTEKLNLIDQRIMKIETVRNDLLELKKKAQALAETLELEEKQDSDKQGQIMT